MLSIVAVAESEVLVVIQTGRLREWGNGEWRKLTCSCGCCGGGCDC